MRETFSHAAIGLEKRMVNRLVERKAEYAEGGVDLSARVRARWGAR